MPKSEIASDATTGYEAKLWAMADALRGSMDAAEYKHVVLGLIFLKYISDAFEERQAKVLAVWGEEAAEDRDEYIAEPGYAVGSTHYHILWKILIAQLPLHTAIYCIEYHDLEST